MEKFKIRLLACLSIVWLLVFVGAANAQEMAVGDQIRDRIERFHMTGQQVVAGEEIAGQDILWKLYEDGAYAPL